MNLADFFKLDTYAWKREFLLEKKELEDLEFAKSDLGRITFIAEQLQNEGFQLIPINSPDYPAVLKENLKVKHSPPLLYIKGRKGLLQEDAVAIVGSRNAGEEALRFTEQVAQKSVQESKVVVSGFAKGVDKQALDSAIEANGKSILVLPQGILTFQTGFKNYYELIVNGNVLVLSTFFPKAGWEVGLAMARNAYIYGLAKEIYVAESDNKGGTWEGALDGLKKGRSVYVRYPDPIEKNANLKLMELGALPVDGEGRVIDFKRNPPKEGCYPGNSSSVNPEIINSEDANRNIEKLLLDYLSKGAYTTREILLALKLDWESRKLTTFLKKNPNVKSIGGKPTKFTRVDTVYPTLFG
jgi:predicted Rossmann fold nucleotide-binding protein DprA/Smf involved in DNA uptake